MVHNKKFNTAKDIETAMEEEFVNRNLDPTDPKMKKIKQLTMWNIVKTPNATVDTVRDSITAAIEKVSDDERAA
jgi:hypothetical protein